MQTRCGKLVCAKKAICGQYKVTYSTKWMWSTNYRKSITINGLLVTLYGNSHS